MSKTIHKSQELLDRFVAGLHPAGIEDECVEHYASCKTCATILHDSFQEEEFVEKYVLYKLSTGQIRSFERHMLKCDYCFQAVSAVEEIAFGLREAVRLKEIELPALSAVNEPKRPTAILGAFESLRRLIQTPGFRNNLHVNFGVS